MKLLVVIRKITAYALLYALRFHIRWVPSEANMSDEPGRQFSLEHLVGSSSFTDNMFDSFVPAPNRAFSPVLSDESTAGPSESDRAAEYHDPSAACLEGPDCGSSLDTKIEEDTNSAKRVPSNPEPFTLGETSATDVAGPGLIEATHVATDTSVDIPDVPD